MDLQLAGKRALVTGSSSGIGAEIARMLAREGVAVVIHGRDAERAAAVAGEISRTGAAAAVATGDLRDPADVAKIVADTNSAFGGIDILVNNAGGNRGIPRRTWLETPPEDWLDTFSSNALPAVRLAQAFAPGMIERGWGRLIQISSRNSIVPLADGAPYAAAKAALNNLTVSLSKALAGTGVTSNTVMPGLTQTPLADPFFAALAKQQGSDDPSVGAEYALKHILQQTVNRVGQPTDVAFVVCMLASPLSDYMTGSIVRVDGGATPTV